MVERASEGGGGGGSHAEPAHLVLGCCADLPTQRTLRIWLAKGLEYYPLPLFPLKTYQCLKIHM